MNMMETIEAMFEEMTAVIYSPGYGAGFSTWSMIDPADQQLAAMIVQHAESIEQDSTDEEKFWVHITESTMKDIMQEMGFEEIPYLKCLRDPLAIKFLPHGTLYRINEYDGSESLEVFHSSAYRMA